MLSLMIRTTEELCVGDIFQLYTIQRNLCCHNIVLARRKTGLSVLRIDENYVPSKGFISFFNHSTCLWQVKTDVVINFRTI